LREDPPESVLGLRLQRGRRAAGRLRAAQPGDRRRRDGLLERERGDQRAAAAPLEARRSGRRSRGSARTPARRPARSRHERRCRRRVTRMTRQAMNIGEASRASGVSPKMIRHYESLGLIPPAERSDAGYRRYSGNDVHLLAFIARARDLGFSITEISQLVSLWQDRSRSSAKVKALALEQIERLDRKVRELLEMKSTLERLAQACHGDGR